MPAHPPPRLLEMDMAAAVEHVLKWKGQALYCLGLPLGAQADNVRKQYKQLALRLHPDKSEHPKAREAFDAIHTAFTVAYRPPAE